MAPKPLVVPAPPPILVGAAGFGIGYKAGRTLGRSEIVPGDTIDEFYTDLFYNLLFNENTSESDESDSPKESAIDRRAREQREARERKHGDSDWEEPASEDYAKWKARELERAQGKDARRSAHDAKGKGEGDRSKSRLDSDYGTE